MDDNRRMEISDLIQKILCRKYRCGVAGENAIKDLWDENLSLREVVEWAISDRALIEVIDIAREKMSGDFALVYQAELRRRAALKSAGEKEGG